ncbi:MAG: hypothetical protein IH946_12205 [Bacteroidetes bacterium]|nr:hypothetical protein [Bacteroidota bacterium]
MIPRGCFFLPNYETIWALNVLTLYTVRGSISIIAASFYLLLSVGLSLNFHFCHNKLADISLGTQGTCPCGPGEMKNCCSDETVILKLDIHPINPIKQEITKANSSSEAVLTLDLIVEVPFNNTYEVPSKDHPPPGLEIYLMNNSLLFYG